MKKLAIIAGKTAGQCVVSARRWSNARCGCADLRRLIAELPELAETDDKLAAVERAFTATFGMPVAVYAPSTTGMEVKHGSAGFQPDDVGAERAATAVDLRSTIFRPRKRRSATAYIPLTTSKGCIGVLAFTGNRARMAKDWNLVRAFAGQTALALLRSDLEEEARYAQALRDLDRFQKTLFDSIAHNVRTPLASIIGALSALQEDGAVLDRPVRRELVDTARQEADRLNRLLGNLLDLSRLESGSVRVRGDHCDVQDVIGAALEQLGPAIRGRDVVITLAPDLPLVPMDFVLIVQVIVNLLDNALKYSRPKSPIWIEARHTGPTVTVSVADDGDGIPGDNPQRVFDKFDRAGRSGEIAGIGLGLSICRGFVEAHRGSIVVERRSPRGTRIAFTLPVRAHAEEVATA